VGSSKVEREGGEGRGAVMGGGGIGGGRNCLLMEVHGVGGVVRGRRGRQRE